MCVLGELLSRHPPGAPPPYPGQAVQPPTAASVAPEVHASVGAVLALLAQLAQAPAPLPWQLEEASHEPAGAGAAGGEPGCCRLAADCATSHEDLSNRE